MASVLSGEQSSRRLLRSAAGFSLQGCSGETDAGSEGTAAVLPTDNISAEGTKTLTRGLQKTDPRCEVRPPTAEEADGLKQLQAALGI